MTKLQSLPFIKIIKRQQLMPSFYDRDLNCLCSSFSQLVQDRYFPAQAGVRYRRYSQFVFDTLNLSLQNLPNTPFIQDKAYNSLAGNIPRKFAPLDIELTESPWLNHLIKKLISYFPCHHRTWKINIHQMRVEVIEGSAQPAPEGKHQDGHDYIALILIYRHQITGGENSVFDTHGNLLLTTLLHNTFDTLLLDDRNTYHSVSEIQSTQREAYRDMLIIDFNKTHPETFYA